MCKNKTTDNCLNCGKFYNEKTSDRPFCKTCSNFCLNCYEPVKRPKNQSSKIPVFCNSFCQEEYHAAKEVGLAIPYLATSLARLHQAVCNMHDNLNLSYKNGVASEAGVLNYEYDSDAEEITCTLKMKQKFEPSR